MSWSIRLGRFLGIDVKVHLTFFLLLFVVAFAEGHAGGSAAAALGGVLFVLALFLCVILHEFGHALAARRYGVKTRDIILLPIGGVARLERMPDKPLQELVVALAGPFVNVVIVAVLVAVSVIAGRPLPSVESFSSGPFLERIAAVNVGLAVFNMLPAFPMDGGRVLRSLLALRFGFTRATEVAATIGQGFALLFGLLGLLNPILILIALFVWIGASNEAGLARLKAAFSGVPVEQVMLTDFRTLSPQDSLHRVVELTLQGSQRDFPVVEGERTVGVVTQPKLFAALAQGGEGQPVAAVMEEDFDAVHPYDMVESVFHRLQGGENRLLPVIEGGRLAGILTLDNIGEFLAIRAALRR